MKLHAVEVRGLRVKLSGREVLKGVDMRAPNSSVTVVMGPSGSGKSTLLRVINRLLDFVPGAEVAGDVRVFGRSVFEEDPYELRRKVVMVQQEPAPFPHLSIFDNVAIAAKINGVAKSKSELYEVVKWALEAVMLWDEVKDRLDQKPSALSGGQKQRLCLARALAAKPEVLLLDEPTANVDPANTLKIEESLRALKEEVSIVMVTHMPHQAARVADHVAIMYDGKIVEEGSAREVFMYPRHEVTKAILRGAL